MLKLVALSVVGLVFAVVPPTAPAQADNPLDRHPWGVYKGFSEPAWAPYYYSSGQKRKLLAKIALRPKATWFATGIDNSLIVSKVKDYIANSQDGDPNALVQLTTFRMVPWEQEACDRLPTAAERRSYRKWTNLFASAIGRTPTAIVLQPDGPFAMCAPGGSKIYSRLLAYSAKVFSELPRTSVYIEAGAADWPSEGQGGVDKAVTILMRAGVRYTRGFALNGTHYSDTNLEVERGAAIVKALRARGVKNKHFVVNTSSNGHPFIFGKFTGANANHAFVCKSKHEPKSRTCVTLGIPPTTKVASPKWKLKPRTNRLARKYADGYLWFGRPWLYYQASPFVLKRALQLVRSTPY